ncbi:XTP/dITP diphosphatase [Pediococcus argentinicus]|uniref:dITP/XTP pyrophosphatase n=1 Tax=Pediococcus argentinicus TaxID=480391 RepID=A0A0R2NIU2_9LACO|nr:XTP/dITP diphosphatase [Pediococcus argentinicus]KRO25260.1 xanthosine triphosphate pyrophosphatase [Pediococcus argentinicus]NKZ22327.1 XTP/dITP diphosphatase [Pediococcus argentinicus]GEP19450.1 non-canonical purine NTP pyrophosphatase [Pediococcus argentinicus]
MEKTIVIATKNEGKLREFKEVFAKKGIDVKSLKDFPEHSEIAETGLTFEENARLKAEGYAEVTGLSVLADDSGLQIDALHGRPGIFSARYAGNHDDAANNAKVLMEMGGIPDEKRTANFHTTLVLRKPDGQELIGNGDVHGRILGVPRGNNGFGYDPLFYLPEKGKTFAELTSDEKNQVSHRGRAIEDLMERFDEFWK